MDKTLELISTISKKNMLQGKYLEKALNNLTSLESFGVENLINFYLLEEHSLLEQAEAYLTFVEDTMEEQKYFIENGSYRYTTFEEVANDVYYNKEYMTKYMIGLALSNYLWSNHLEILRWHAEKIKFLSGSKYLEIGPGHGEYFVQAIKNSNFKKYTAVDISETSVNITKKFTEYSLKKQVKDYQVICRDFFTFTSEDKYDAIVMGEVLEHVEEPRAFLNKILELSHKDTFVYITTVINAPARDHIYLFKTIEDVLEMVREANFKVVDYITPTGNSMPLEKAIKRKAPINIALVLQKLD